MLDRFFKSTLISLLFLLAIAYATRIPIDRDFWLHLKQGELILKSCSVPYLDTFSYAKQSSHYIDHEWAFQLLVYLLHKQLGLVAIVILKIVIILSILTLFFLISRRCLNFLSAFSLTLIVLLVTSARFLERPQLFSLLFTLVVLFLLDRYKYEGKDALNFLPILLILWVNIHGYFAIGLSLILFYFLMELPNYFLKVRFWKDTHPIQGVRLLRLLFIAALSTLACFVNPYFNEGILYPFIQIKSFIGGDAARKYIAELQPSLYALGNSGLFALKTLIAVSLFAILLNWRRVAFVHLMSYIIFLCLMFSSIRHIDLFAIVAGFLIVSNFADARQSSVAGAKVQQKRKIFPMKISRCQWVIYFIFATVFIWLILNVVRDSIFTKTGQDIQYGSFALDTTYPQDAAKFIKENNIKGNMFNEFGWGNYLLWQLYPEKQVFIDGRTEIYGNEFLQFYMNMFKFQKVFDEAVSRYKINYIILPVDRDDIRKFIKKLYHSAKWKLIFIDGNSVVFIKDVDENKDIVERYAIDLSKQPPSIHPHTKDFGVWAHRLPLATRQPIKPYPYAFINKGLLYSELGFPDRAIDEFKQAININPLIAFTYNNLGNAYANKGMMDEAIAEYKKALKLNRHFYDARFNMALAYEKKGRIEDAMREYRKIPASVLSHFRK